MKFRIKLSYTTGDSFGSESTQDYLELEWDIIEVAKDNLQRIKEHYKMYRDLNSYSYKKKSKDEIFAENKEKSWFVYSPKLFSKNGEAITQDTANKIGRDNYIIKPDEHLGTYCLKLIADNGNEMQISAFWCGYFETLHSAEIEFDDSDIRIEF